MMAGDRTKRSRSRSSSISERKSVKKKKSRSRCRHSSSSPSPVRKPSSLAKYHSQSPEYSKKERRKKKSKRRASTSSSETSSSSSSSSSSSDDSSDSESKPKQNKHQRKKAKHRKGKKVKKKSKKAKKNTTKLKKKELKIRTQQSLPGPSLDLCQDQSKDSAPGLTDVQKSRVQAMRPMTKEEWDARQSVIRKVVDPETGRMRLIKGDGEILEEIVSRDRHKEINKQATQNDGLTFQMRSGML